MNFFFSVDVVPAVQESAHQKGDVVLVPVLAGTASNDLCLKIHYNRNLNFLFSKSPSQLTSEPVILDSWNIVRNDQSNFDAWMHLLNLVDQYVNFKWLLSSFLYLE